MPEMLKVRLPEGVEIVAALRVLEGVSVLCGTRAALEGLQKALAEVLHEDPEFPKKGDTFTGRSGDLRLYGIVADADPETSTFHLHLEGEDPEAFEGQEKESRG